MRSVQSSYLLLKCEDVSDTTIDRVAKSGLSLIGNGHRGLAPVVLGHVQQQLGRVAGPEHLVYGREARNPMLVAEVGGKDAVGRALAPQELACPAGGARARARARRAHV